MASSSSSSMNGLTAILLIFQMVPRSTEGERFNEHLLFKEAEEAEAREKEERENNATRAQNATWTEDAALTVENATSKIGNTTLTIGNATLQMEMATTPGFAHAYVEDPLIYHDYHELTSLTRAKKRNRTARVMVNATNATNATASVPHDHPAGFSNLSDAAGSKGQSIGLHLATSASFSRISEK